MLLPLVDVQGLASTFYPEFFTLARIELLERVVVAHGREDVIYAIESHARALELHMINVCTILPHYHSDLTYFILEALRLQEVIDLIVRVATQRVDRDVAPKDLFDLPLPITHEVGGSLRSTT